MMASQHPPFAWSAEGPVSREALLGHAAAVAPGLPDYEYVVNLCEDRYLFSVGFLAALRRGQVTLLPPSQEPVLMANTMSGEGRYYFLVDRGMTPPWDHPHHALDYVRVHHDAYVPTASEWVSDPDRTAVVGFTSGSTGIPRSHSRTWQALYDATHMALRRFNLDDYNMVATVPAQHMYGFECSVLYPLLGRVAVNTGRPFFPDDIRATLESITAPRVLVTTPVHLRACLGARLTWPSIDLVISATSSLPRSLADDVERVMGSRVREIYGCTETGAIASRDTTASSRWTLYGGMRLQMKQSRAFVSGPQLKADTQLPDVVRQVNETCFELIGRSADQINVGGKRASLADLNGKLLAIEGVQDGVIVMPHSEYSGTVIRPVALVVAPSLDEAGLRARLGEVMPAVFVPRPIYLVPKLPHNAAGKLPRGALMALLEEQRRRSLGFDEKEAGLSGKKDAVPPDDTGLTESDS